VGTVIRITVKVPTGLMQAKTLLDAAIESGVQRSTGALANEAIKNAPRKTGNLKRSIYPEVNPMAGQFTGKVIQDTTVAKYGPWVEQGTGIYGPFGTPIVPVRAKALAWKGSDGKMIFARSVKGMQGKFYMKRAFEKAPDIVNPIMQAEVVKALVKMGAE
jgi:hypothetical protein